MFTWWKPFICWVICRDVCVTQLRSCGDVPESYAIAGCLVYSLLDTFFKTYKNVQHRSNTNWNLKPSIIWLAVVKLGYFRSYHSQIDTFSCNFHTSFLRLRNWSMVEQITSSLMFHSYHASLWFFLGPVCQHHLPRSFKNCPKSGSLLV